MGVKKPKAPDVLIVGAGTTGLTAAVELARRGIIPRVIERREKPSQLSRAVGLLPSSMELLSPSGAADLIRDEAIVVSRVIIHKHERPRATLRCDLLQNPDHRLLALAQDRTEALLRDRLIALGGCVEFKASLEGFEQSSKKVTATINGTSSKFDYLIGADGTRSSVRQGIGATFDGYDLSDLWSIADVEVNNWPDGNAFKIFALDDGVAAVAIPLARNRVRLISSSDDAIGNYPHDIDIAHVRRSGSFNISVRIASEYQKGRVFLAGDAAHCHSPAGGRGMNLGIADAANLARRMANGELESYGLMRKFVGQETIALSERARKMVQMKAPIKRELFMQGAAMVSRVPALNRMVLKRLLDL